MDEDRPVIARRRLSGWGLAVFGTVAIAILVIGLAVARRDMPGTRFPYGDPAPLGRYAQGWDEVEPSPLSARAAARVVWTGEEVLVFGGMPDHACGDCDLTEGLRDAAAYDPATDRWRPLPDVPLDVLRYNTTITVAGDQLLAKVVINRDSRLLTYDLATDRWAETLAPDLVQLNLVADGDRVFFVRGCACPREPRHEQVLNLSTGEWSDLPPDPFPEAPYLYDVVVDHALYRFGPRLRPAQPDVGVAVLRPGATAWEILQSDGLLGWAGELEVVGDLIVGADQPFAIDTDETFPPATSAFDTRAEDWVSLPRLTEPMESGLTASDGEYLWFGDQVLDAATRSWADGEYRPETATDASTVWLGDRWFAFGGQTALGMTRRAFIWSPTAGGQGQS